MKAKLIDHCISSSSSSTNNNISNYGILSILLRFLLSIIGIEIQFVPIRYDVMAVNFLIVCNHKSSTIDIESVTADKSDVLQYRNQGLLI